MYTASGSYAITFTATDKDGATGTATTTASIHPAVAVPHTTATRTVNEGSPLTLTGSVSGGATPLTYQWAFGDTTTSGSLTATHTYADGPHTYTAILTVLRDRGYVRMDKKRLIPEDKGRLVTAFLEVFFRRYVEYDFTANLEEQLDRISNGEVNWKEVLRDFWRDFIAAVGDIKELRITEVLDALNDLLAPHIFPEKPEGGDARQCTSCGNGRLSLKIGKFGAFIGCSNYPDCRYTRPISTGEAAEKEAIPPEVLSLELIR